VFSIHFGQALVELDLGGLGLSFQAFLFNIAVITLTHQSIDDIITLFADISSL
jgi:hypothetical protein